MVQSASELNDKIYRMDGQIDGQVDDLGQIIRELSVKRETIPI